GIPGIAPGAPRLRPAGQGPGDREIPGHGQGRGRQDLPRRIPGTQAPVRPARSERRWVPDAAGAPRRGRRQGQGQGQGGRQAGGEGSVPGRSEEPWGLTPYMSTDDCNPEKPLDSRGKTASVSGTESIGAGSGSPHLGIGAAETGSHASG